MTKTKLLEILEDVPDEYYIEIAIDDHYSPVQLIFLDSIGSIVTLACDVELASSDEIIYPIN